MFVVGANFPIILEFLCKNPLAAIIEWHLPVVRFHCRNASWKAAESLTIPFVEFATNNWPMSFYTKCRRRKIFIAVQKAPIKMEVFWIRFSSIEQCPESTPVLPGGWNPNENYTISNGTAPHAFGTTQLICAKLSLLPCVLALHVWHR